MENSSSNNKGLTAIIVFMFLFLAGITAYFIYQNQQLLKEKSPNVAETTVDVPETEPSPEAAEPVETTEEISPQPSPDAYADWQVYVNEEYGFQFSFPEGFEALSDENNLYGWPQAVVLLYEGGQAHDIPVEVWDSETEYKDKYQNQLSELVVKEVNGKYITFHNNTGVDLFDEITASFKKL